MEIIIDGNNFHTLEGFYDEVEVKLAPDLGKGFGRNLNAYNDVLRGGFGLHEYEEPLTIKWINSDKSRKDLGQQESIKYMEEALKNSHPTNIQSLKKELEDLKSGKGESLFETILHITREHDHIKLILE